MAKPDAYVRPDGPEIRKKRKIENLSPEELAERAGVGVSTVKRAERSFRVQLRNLSKIAIALDVKLETIAPGIRTPQSVQVLDRWGQEFDLMATADESILIIDSYFSEYGRLGAALRTRSKSQKQGLNIEVYMASPEMDYGAQRLREMTDLVILRSMANPEIGYSARPLLQLHDRMNPGSAQSDQLPLGGQLTDSARKNYEAHFHILEESTRNAASPYAASIKIFEYFCMPGLRIVAIDNVHYIFGWFPLFAQNPSHTAFYLKDENLEGADVELLNEIRMQIDHVKAVSIPAMNRLGRPRKNRREASPPGNP